MCDGRVSQEAFEQQPAVSVGSNFAAPPEIPHCVAGTLAQAAQASQAAQGQAPWGVWVSLAIHGHGHEGHGLSGGRGQFWGFETWKTTI